MWNTLKRLWIRKWPCWEMQIFVKDKISPKQNCLSHLWWISPTYNVQISLCQKHLNLSYKYKKLHVNFFLQSAWQKKFLFNFISVPEIRIFGPKFAKSVCGFYKSVRCLPNAICQCIKFLELKNFGEKIGWKCWWDWLLETNFTIILRTHFPHLLYESVSFSFFLNLNFMFKSFWKLSKSFY